MVNILMSLPYLEKGEHVSRCVDRQVIERVSGRVNNWCMSERISGYY